jgi:hypothetical protein
MNETIPTKQPTGRLLGFQEPQESVGVFVGFLVDSQGPDQESVGLPVGFLVGFQAPDQESAGLLVGLMVYSHICSSNSSERGKTLRLFKILRLGGLRKNSLDCSKEIWLVAPRSPTTPD